METKTKEEIREVVRERYGKIARDSGVPSEEIQKASCCESTGIAIGESLETSCCGSTDFSTHNISETMGYTEADLKSVPDGSNMGLGCGNPVALASLQSGETVVDLGSGGGFDCFLAAKRVGETGKVIGVDMTPDMVSKARKNAEKIEATNVEFRLGEIEHLPVADNSADIIISNCVINLSPDKQQVYSDAYRALKPGGRLCISDILATSPLPENIKNDLKAVSACVGGAELIHDTRERLEKIGFTEIKITSKDESRDLISEWAPGKNAGDYVVSAYIEAVKPL